MKIKAILIAFCLVILALLLTNQKDFYQDRHRVDYKELSWNDFRGTYFPLSFYDASIYSEIYWKYDEAAGRYKAFASMQKDRSWVKNSVDGDEDLLRHEQYHFEITKYIADKLDLTIVREKLESESEIEQAHQTIMGEWNRLQDAYDGESDHSIHIDQQRKWEYKIDSLRSSLRADETFAHDVFSGAKAYLPEASFTVVYDSISKHLERTFLSEAYGMHRSLNSINYNYYSETYAAEIKDQLLESEDLELISFEHNKNEDYAELRIEIYAQENGLTQKERRIFKDNYTYILTASYWEEIDDIEGFEYVANSFINSFAVQGSEDQWIEAYHKSLSKENVHSTLQMGQSEPNGKTVCYTPADEFSYKGFPARPIALDEETVIIPHFVTDSLKNELSEYVLGYGSTFYIFEIDSSSTIFHVPKSALKKNMSIGYVYKKDSLTDCFPVHSMPLLIN